MQENLNLVEGANIELIRTGDDVSINNTYVYDDSGIEAEIQQLETSLQNYSLISETGNKVQIELNNTNYKMKVKLLDKNDNVINTSNEVDLPIEQLVTSITYDSATKELVFTLKDGTQTRVPLSDLISGLVTEDDFNESQEEQNETIEALKEKVEVYKTIFNALPHIEDEDTEMTLDDTANSVMEMTLKGNTSQTGTPTPNTSIPINVVSGDNEVAVIGKNWFDKDSTTTQVGYFTSTGEIQSGSSSTITTSYTRIIPNTQMYLSGETNIIENVCYYDKNKNFIERVISDVKSINKDAYYIRFQITTSSLNLDTLQLEVGSSATTYEPYQSQIYPIYLGVENLITSFTRTSGGNQIYFNDVSDYSNNFIFEAGTYTISYTTESNDISTYIKTESAGSSTNKGTGNPITFTTTEKFNIWLYKSGLQEGEVSDVKMTKGSIASHTSTTPIELCKIGDYQDYFYKDSGNWYLHKEIGKVVLNGSENWEDRPNYSYADRFVLNLVWDTGNKNMFCNYFIAVETATDTYPYIIRNGTQCIINFGAKGNKTLAQFKEWLSSHNTIVYLILETPYLSLIEDTTLIEQLDNIQNAMSYEGQTNIGQVNNDKPFIISASALKDLTNLESGE